MQKKERQFPTKEFHFDGAQIDPQKHLLNLPRHPMWRSAISGPRPYGSWKNFRIFKHSIILVMWGTKRKLSMSGIIKTYLYGIYGHIMTTPINHTHLWCGATARHHHPKGGLVGYQMKALGARNRKYTSLLQCHQSCHSKGTPVDHTHLMDNAVFMNCANS